MTALDTTPATAPTDGPHDRAALRTAIDATMQLAAAAAGPVRTAVREAMADAVTDLVAPILDRLATERNTMMTALESHQLNQRVGIVSVAQAVAATDEARRKDRRWKGAVAQARKEHARANELQLWGEQLLRAGSSQLTELVVSQREARSAVAERARLAEVLREVIARCESIPDGWGSDGNRLLALQISRQQYDRWRLVLESGPADARPTPASAPQRDRSVESVPCPRCDAQPANQCRALRLDAWVPVAPHPERRDALAARILADATGPGPHTPGEEPPLAEMLRSALDSAIAPSADTDAAHGS